MKIKIKYHIIKIIIITSQVIAS